MYKSRPMLWLIATCVVLVVWMAQGIVGCMSYEAPTYNLYCDSSDNLLRKKLSSASCNEFNYNMYDNAENADIIMMESSNTTITGYKKYSNYVFTPIVLFARDECRDEKSGFTVYSAGTSSSTCYKDLYPILIAIEEGKQFADIGISKNVATGEVKLCIPAENNIYYDAVVNTIYATLNGGIPTMAERQALKERVDKILDKCEKVEDIGSTILGLYKKDDKNYSLFLGPENILGISTTAINTSNSGAWSVVYLTKTCTYSFDVFIRDCEMHDTYLKTITSKEFTSATRCRVYNTNYMPSCYSHTIETITTF